MPSRQEIVEAAKSWKGTPFRHQGRGQSGLDCCGLIIRVGNDLDMITYDTTAYSRRANGDAFVHHFRDAGMIELPIAQALPGDVLITTDHRFPCHCGIVAEHRGRPSMIHAYAWRRKVVEDWLENWTPKAVAVMRFPGVID